MPKFEKNGSEVKESWLKTILIGFKYPALLWAGVFLINLLDDVIGSNWVTGTIGILLLILAAITTLAALGMLIILPFVLRK